MARTSIKLPSVRLVAYFFVLSTFSRHLCVIRVHKHDQMESVLLVSILYHVYGLIVKAYVAGVKRGGKGGFTSAQREKKGDFSCLLILHLLHSARS